MIDERLAAFPPRRLSPASRTVSYREAGAGEPIVLLHGIGSSSASWLFQLEGLSHRFRLIAWDAPGYGESDELGVESPNPRDYAAVLEAFAGALGLSAFALVGQSLGALMAGAFAREYPRRVKRLVLLSPAGGYANGDPGLRQQAWVEREAALDELGPEGLAETRAPEMLSPAAPPVSLELVRWSYRRIRRMGYLEAAHCLVNGHLAEDAAYCPQPTIVACGSEDRITPEAGCRAIAAAFPHGEYRPLPGLGHACQAEDPERVNALIAGG